MTSRLAPLEDVRAAVGALGRGAAGVTAGAFDGRGLLAYTAGDEIAGLTIVDGRRVLVDRSLACTDTLDYGYEGCSAGLVGWIDGHVVLTTAERGAARLWRVEPGGATEIVVVRGALCVLGDVAVFAADVPGLLGTAYLPSLDAGPPLPLRSAWPHVALRGDETGRVIVLTRSGRDWQERDRLTLPPRVDPPRDLFARVEERLRPAPPGPLRFIVETVASPFRGEAPWRGPWQPTLAWLPVHLHRHLMASGRGREAESLLALHDALAAPLGPEDPERGAIAAEATDVTVELAARAVRRSARVLGDAIRAGRLPDGFYSMVFLPAPRSTVRGSRVDSARLPETLRAVFLELVAAGMAD
jgi:hypothetical protein